MKKLFCLFLCAVMLLSLCSFAQVSAAPLKWSEETQNMIKRDYARFRKEDSVGKVSADDVKIIDFLGVYQNNKIALIIVARDISFCMSGEEDVAGFHFVYPDHLYSISIYHDRTFTPLNEAYKNGIISKEDVKDIYNWQRNNPDSEVISEIKGNYAKYLRETTNNSEITAENIAIKYLSGLYHGVYAVCFSDINGNYASVEEDVDGLHFTLSDTSPVYIYCDQAFTPLKEAYEAGLISKRHIMDICSEFWTETNDERRNKVQQAFAEYHNKEAAEDDITTADDVYVKYYFGTYQNNAVALFFAYSVYDPSSLSMCKYSFSDDVKEEIAGCIFEYPELQPLCIYWQEKLLTLKEAYESGVVLKEDVEKIYLIFEEGAF